MATARSNESSSSCGFGAGYLGGNTAAGMGTKLNRHPSSTGFGAGYLGFSQGSLGVLSRFSRGSLKVLSKFSEGSLEIVSRFSRCSLNLHSNVLSICWLWFFSMDWLCRFGLRQTCSISGTTYILIHGPGPFSLRISAIVA